MTRKQAHLRHAFHHVDRHAINFMAAVRHLAEYRMRAADALRTAHPDASRDYDLCSSPEQTRPLAWLLGQELRARASGESL